MKKRLFVTFFVLGFFISSIFISDLSQGLIAPDELKLTKGSYVKGNYLYTNDTHTDVLIWKNEVIVEDIFKPRDSPYNLIQLKVSYNYSEDVEFSFFEAMTTVEWTQLIFEHNRTTLLFAGRIFLSNSTWSLEISTLYLDTIAGLTNESNVKITYINGTSYIIGEVDPLDPRYPELESTADYWKTFNQDIKSLFPWTIFAISPKAEIDNEINFKDNPGKVVDKPSINVSTEPYDTIHVAYNDSFTFSFEMLDEVEVYYEATTGLLLSSYENQPGYNLTLRFVPYEINIKTSNAVVGIVVGVVLGVAAISAIIVYFKKKKK